MKQLISEHTSRDRNLKYFSPQTNKAAECADQMTPL